MPRIYLSPSTQESNLYVSGGSEEYYMNLLADELIPYLRANTIAYTRNTPQMTAVSSVRQANQGDYDFYLALHSNAAGPANVGRWSFITPAAGRASARRIFLPPTCARFILCPTTCARRLRQPFMR